MEWYSEQPPAAQAAFDTLVEHLAVRPRQEWRRPDFDLLGGKQAGIGELRFTSANVAYRPLGFFGPKQMEFTFLVGSTKKGKNYSPIGALETAVSRRKDVETGKGSTHVWSL